jgi:hypothetical protein
LSGQEESGRGGPGGGSARRERAEDEPTAPHPGDLEDPAERAKDAMRKAGERARRVKRPGASGRRGSDSAD